MADSQIAVTEGSGKNVDTRTNAAGDHRQVIVIGNPTATDSVAEVQATDPSSNALGLVVRDVNGSAMVAAIQGISIQDITRVKNVVDGTLSLVTRVDRVMNLVDGTLSTLSSITNALPTGANDLGNIVRVKNVVDGTLSTVTGVDRIRNVIDGTLATVVRVSNLVAGTVTVTGITASVNVHILSTNGTMAVNVGKVDGTVTVRTDPGFTLGKVEPGIGMFNQGSTASIFSVSGSFSGNYPSGFTLVSPSANYNFKVFAYSIQTTGIVSEQWTFTNGGGSPTEFWRPLITAVNTTSAPIGANLAIQPPGYLFATGTSTTLALKAATGSLVHYSVSFIKESS